MPRNPITGEIEPYPYLHRFWRGGGYFGPHYAEVSYRQRYRAKQRPSECFWIVPGTCTPEDFE